MAAKLFGWAGLAVKIFLVLFAVFIFFFTYNKFLIDHSLKSLEFSLINIEEGAVVGVDDVLKHIAVEAVVTNNFRDSMKLEYVRTTLSRVGDLSDAKALVSSMIKTRRAKGGVALNVLDKIALKFDNFKNFVLSLGRRKSPAYLINAFGEAKRLFNQKDFDSAKKKFQEIARYGYGTSFGRSASLYLKNIEIYRERRKRIDELLKDIEIIKEPENLQRFYFEIANLYMSILEYKKSEDFFNKALVIAPKTEVAQRAYFGLGFTKKMQGRLTEASQILDSFAKEFPQSKLVLQTKLELADIFRRQAKHDDAARYYYSLAKEFKDSPLVDVILFQASAIYRFDLGKLQEANKILLELFKNYPASELLDDAKKFFERTGLLWEETQLSLPDRVTLSLIKSAPPLSQLLKLAERGAVWYALYMIEGSIKQALLQKKKKGDVLTIERTAKFLTRWVNYRINQFVESFKQFKFSLEDFIVEFPKEGWVEVRVVIGIAGFKWKSYALGKMYLKQIKQPYQMWEEERTPRRWVVFDIQESKIGPVKLPHVVANYLIKKAEATFNKKQVFWQRRLKITPYIGIWEGPLKYDPVELRKRLQEIERYKKAIR